jgi:hypothetical protein
MSNVTNDIHKYRIAAGRYNYNSNILTTIDWQVLTADTDYDFDVHVPFGDMIVFMNLYGRANTSNSTSSFIGTPGDSLNLWSQNHGNDGDGTTYVNNYQSLVCDASKQLRTVSNTNDSVARYFTMGFQMPDYIYTGA